MSEWTTPVDRRRVMALWSTCYQVGGLVATAGAAWLLSFGWRSAFFVPAVLMGAVGVLVLVGLRPGPGAPSSFADRGDADGADGDEAERRAAVRAVLRSPLLWCIGASYFAMKLIRYSLLFWLPYYLVDDLGYAPGSAGYLSTAFELGGIAGVVGIGLLSHRLSRVSRPLLASITLVGLSGLLVAYQLVAKQGPLANALGLGLVGAFLFGPDSILSGAAAQDAGGKHAAATATGFVNAVGSVGAILQGALNAWVSQAFGWQAVFYVLVGFALLAALALVPAFSRDVTPA
jgi:sugar phosphate permease